MSQYIQFVSAIHVYDRTSFQQRCYEEGLRVVYSSLLGVVLIDVGRLFVFIERFIATFAHVFGAGLSRPVMF